MAPTTIAARIATFARPRSSAITVKVAAAIPQTPALTPPGVQAVRDLWDHLDVAHPGRCDARTESTPTPAAPNAMDATSNR